MPRITGRWLRYAALAVSASLFSPGAPVSAAPSLEARIRTLNDASQIRHLLVEYGHALDTSNWAAYSQLFAKDGGWNDTSDLPRHAMTNVVGGSATGPAAIFALMTKKLGSGAGAKPYDPNNVQSVHLMTNFIVHVNGDEATAYSRWTVLAKSPDHKLYPRQGGHYFDTLVRENGQWKFKLRLVLHDIPNPE